MKKAGPVGVQPFLTLKSDEDMCRIQREMSDMVKDKEACDMLMQEKHYRMDWIT